AGVVGLNFFCILRQLAVPGWNLLYPSQDGSFPTGVFSHYNYAAGFCLAAAGLLLRRAALSQGWLRGVILGFGLLALLSVPLSSSRGGNIALAVMVSLCVLVLVFRDRNAPVSRTWYWFPGLVLAAALPFLILYLAPIVLVPLTGRGAGSGGFFADGGRIDMWTAALRIANDFPWRGVGAGGYEWMVYQYLSDLFAEPSMAHHEALQLAAEYGYPALLVMLGLFAIPVLRGASRVISLRQAYPDCFLCAAVVAVLVQSNFSFLFHTAPGVFIATYLLGELCRSFQDRSQKGIRAGLDMSKPADWRWFLSVLHEHCADFEAGKRGALMDLHQHLVATRSRLFEERAYDLTFWQKRKNWSMLEASVRSIRKDFPMGQAPPADALAPSLGRTKRRFASWLESRSSRERRKLIERIHRHGRDCLAGSRQALQALSDLLISSRVPMFEERGYDLLYWRKQQNAEKETHSLKCLLQDFSVPEVDLGRFRWLARLSGIYQGIRKLLAPPMVAALWVVVFAMLAFGGWTSRALAQSWSPLYRSAGLEDFERFSQMVDVIEAHRGIGLDRRVMKIGLSALYQFDALEDRELWADVYRSRLLDVIEDWKLDPGCALQMAEVMGWAGDVDAASRFYQHAIRLQGQNETLFLSRAFYGRYLHELALSAGYDGDLVAQKEWLELARSELKASEESARWLFRRDFAEVLKACEEELATLPEP
ncbi:MAG: O-antigen ligase family protein, partial [Luteolibacter sp.]